MASANAQFTSPKQSSKPGIDGTPPRNSRKCSSYGGNRAWSDKEECYLLESRHRKTPYKHIAQHLQKTELACRLHYHQLAYSTKRKRRSTSASSNSTSQYSMMSRTNTTQGHTPRTSIDSSDSRVDQCPLPKLALPAVSPPSSPSPQQRIRLTKSKSPETDQSVRLLPAVTMAATATIPSCAVFSSFPVSPTLQAWPQLMPNFASPTYNYSRVLDRSPAQAAHPDASFEDQYSASAPPTFDGSWPASPHSIDFCRLSKAYSNHNKAFWNTIARNYGCGLSPSVLETAFLRQSTGRPANSLPTSPHRSPVLVAVAAHSPTEDECRYRSSNSHNKEKQPHEPATFSVASMLTVDQDVWSARRSIL